MDAGRLLGWLKRAGERVKVGEAYAEIETDKAVVQMVSQVEGVLVELLARPGTDVTVGEAIAVIEDGRPCSEPVGSPRAPTSQPPSSGSTTSVPKPLPAREASGDAIPVPPAQGAGSAVRATPMARQRARDLGLDVGTVRGTGPGGIVTTEDIDRASKSGWLGNEPDGEGRT